MSLHGKLCISGILTTVTTICIGTEFTGKSVYIPKMSVRHPVDFQPIIPGSSLRGAIRSALGKKYEQQKINAIFGISHKQPGIPTVQVTFRDAFLTNESREQLLAASQETYLSEIKTFARMDRITSQGSCYALEGIPAGAYFGFEFLCSMHTKDFSYSARLLEGMSLLESLMLGSHGSRGQGKIKFGKWQTDPQQLEEGIAISWRPREYYETGSGEKPLVDPQQKLKVADIIDQYDELIGAIGL